MALPLLTGFCQASGLEVEVLDLNIEVAEALGVRITADEAVGAVAGGTLGSLNTPYFAAEQRLQDAAASYGGRWSIAEGFWPQGFSASSSDAVRRAATSCLPYTEFCQKKLLARAQEYSVVGFSVAVPGQLLASFHLAWLLREAGYDGRLLLGGNTVTRLAAELEKEWVFDFVDGVVLYGGELALSAILGGEDRAWPQEIPNLMWKRGGRIIRNSLTQLTPNDFAQPVYDQIASQNYWGIPYLPTVGFRGCYFNRCPFCAIPYGWGEKGALGMDSPLEVLRSLRTASAVTGIRRFKFIDEAIHPVFLNQFIALLEEGGDNIEFEAYARLDPFLVDGELMGRAGAVGLRKLYIGLELSPGGGRSGLGKEDYANPEEVIRSLSDVGVKVHLFCMFGFPGTGEGDVLRTVEYLLRNSDYIDTVDIAQFHLEKHTSIPGLKRVNRDDEDWALWHRYEGEPGICEEPAEVAALVADVEDLLWQERPQWFHPVYRLCSPWAAGIGAVGKSNKGSS